MMFVCSGCGKLADLANEHITEYIDGSTHYFHSKDCYNLFISKPKTFGPKQEHKSLVPITTSNFKLYIDIDKELISVVPIGMNAPSLYSPIFDLPISSLVNILSGDIQCEK